MARQPTIRRFVWRSNRAHEIHGTFGGSVETVKGTVDLGGTFFTEAEGVIVNGSGPEGPVTFENALGDVSGDGWRCIDTANLAGISASSLVCVKVGLLEEPCPCNPVSPCP